MVVPKQPKQQQPSLSSLSRKELSSWWLRQGGATLARAKWLAASPWWFQTTPQAFYYPSPPRILLVWRVLAALGVTLLIRLWTTTTTVSNRVVNAPGVAIDRTNFERFKRQQQLQTMRRRRSSFATVPYSPLRAAFEAKEVAEGPPPQQQQPPSFGHDNYNHHYCPLHDPPAPRTWPLLDILQHWNPNDLEIPQQDESLLFQSLCVLDWNVHSYEQMQAYRQAEVPFVLQNHPELSHAAARWNSQSSSATAEPYWLQLLERVGPQVTEFAAQSNHLPFWRTFGASPLDWTPPTEMRSLTIREWYQHVQALNEALAEVDEKEDSSSASAARRNQVITSADHYYWHLNANVDSEESHSSSSSEQQHQFLYDELRVFRPDGPNVDPLFVVEPDEAHGINCRFGMVGTRTDAHFDADRNWLVVLTGMRRYILAPPEQCRHLDLHPPQHVQARHSAVDWTDFDAVAASPLRHAQALQVILQPGQALYLPTSWFHFIVSLTNATIQCNARSGSTQHYDSPLHRTFRECGFDFYV